MLLNTANEKATPEMLSLYISIGRRFLACRCMRLFWLLSFSNSCWSSGFALMLVWIMWQGTFKQLFLLLHAFLPQRVYRFVIARVKSGASARGLKWWYRREPSANSLPMVMIGKLLQLTNLYSLLSPHTAQHTYSTLKIFLLHYKWKCS